MDSLILSHKEQMSWYAIHGTEAGLPSISNFGLLAMQRTCGSIWCPRFPYKFVEFGVYLAYELGQIG